MLLRASPSFIVALIIAKAKGDKKNDPTNTGDDGECKMCVHKNVFCFALKNTLH